MPYVGRGSSFLSNVKSSDDLLTAEGKPLGSTSQVIGGGTEDWNLTICPNRAAEKKVE